MISKWVITPIYPIYRQVIAHLLTIDIHLLTSWDIQVLVPCFFGVVGGIYFHPLGSGCGYCPRSKLEIMVWPGMEWRRNYNKS